MDEFFQKLREIQKKERNLSGLAPVGENFYHNVSRYFNALMRKIDDNPFSFESYLLRDAQRITAEICERREHKISNSAVMSVQRTYQLFKESETDSPQVIQKIPRNSTPEEEKLYHALVDSLVNYREKMRGPLRFQVGNIKDRESYEVNIDDKESDLSASSSSSKEEMEKNVSHFESSIIPESKSEFKDLKLSDTDDYDENRGFTVEEEAAIDDDVYKKFGREPFPGNNLGKSVVKSPSKDQNEKPGSNELIKGNKTSKNHSNQKKIQTDVLLVLEELPSIMGVDKKVYGPLLPQDIITIPEPNARIIIKNQKGKSIQKYK